MWTTDELTAGKILLCYTSNKCLFRARLTGTFRSYGILLYTQKPAVRNDQLYAMDSSEERSYPFRSRSPITFEEAMETAIFSFSRSHSPIFSSSRRCKILGCGGMPKDFGYVYYLATPFKFHGVKIDDATSRNFVTFEALKNERWICEIII